MSIGIGIVGLGFMGRTHLAAYRAAGKRGHDNHLVAVCDADPERRAGRAGAAGNLEAGGDAERMFDPAIVRAYPSPAELFADEDVELVSICTPTDTHVELALAALEAGKHVLVEKPVAVSASEVTRLASAARQAKTLCMPAHCMRFWPGWDWLEQKVRSGEFGAVRSAVFRRLAAPPAWSPEFYADAARTGGALVDLHIHDADFVRYLFGEPDRVTSAGTLDHVTTLYHYANGPAHVVAEGGWDHTPGFAFQMRYVVVFEEATAEFDLGRAPRLTLSRGGETVAVELPEGDGYVGEISHLLEKIRRGSHDLRVTVDEARDLARMLEAERMQL
ncbi:MAG: Gfo/Idh/MocA family oxidoreductase [Planctomycetes bacterium]|nr:Gfo/Idh/MocA family oxidoreductase [Planctomycetota bacterium]